MNLCVVLREQWRKFDILTQASGSSLSESIRNPPKCLRELSLRRRAPVFEREVILLKRGGLA